MTQKTLMLLLFVLAILLWGIGIAVVLRALQRGQSGHQQQAALRDELERQLDRTRLEIQNTLSDSFRMMSQTLSSSQKESASMWDKRLEALNQQLNEKQLLLQKTVSEQLRSVDERLDSSSRRNELKLESIRQTMETKITALQEDNAKKLEQMRMTVDEKLQKTLDERLSQSFSQVSQRLEQVYKGLGEMQTLATGVGDLKKVLSNVKTRGILGEIQLGAILEQMLSPEQYVTNAKTKKDSANFVEFAVRLPGNDENEVLLPIDAKFPGDCYAALADAYDSCDADRIATASKELERRIKQSAKDIHDKYIDPPATTEFAIMFLPVEGLYAEVVRMGLIETLSREYRINVAGPTTMAALLNSLQMGFKTLALQKRSGEVWQVLGGVKTEFSKFATVLQSAQSRLQKTNEDLDKLIGVRTRAIERKLRQVEEVPLLEEEAAPLALAAAVQGDSDD